MCDYLHVREKSPNLVRERNWLRRDKLNQKTNFKDFILVDAMSPSLVAFILEILRFKWNSYS
jgi:hypothetical protein